MPEIGPTHPITYRAELTAPLFARIHAGESCAVVGAASMGKSRLLQFLLRPDVATHYLTTLNDGEPKPTLLLWIDCNRMAAFTAWGLHELILTALVESCGEHPTTRALRDDLTEWRREVITTRNGLLAQRYVELALQLFCKEQELNLCLILDEFDEAYASLPAQALANLRALRDRHKYQLSYLLFTRDHPRYLRNPDECEGFYELISRSVLGLQPYTEMDARRVFDQITARRSHELGTFDDDAQNALLHLSGHHPGLLVALIDALIAKAPVGKTWETWGREQPKVLEECRKIWRGLRREEREALRQVVRQDSVDVAAQESLRLKGLVTANQAKGSTPQPANCALFSPLFADYVREQGTEQEEGLYVDEAGTVWVNGRRTEDLTGKEHELMRYLYDHLGEICETEALISHLYPGDEGYNMTDNNVASIVGRLRKKIEPANTPQYLLNVRGRGYKLVAESVEG
ncbi:MAG TPA: winged helix-turn-helix domain-containing protein [Caldilineaceae bacterium]|nr:winged helix-turn-helix domain-containing protein [Caldilineaceae bacterium]